MLFSYIEVQSSWRRRMAGPVVWASELPSSYVQGRWSPSTRLRPCYRRLAMGSTRSVLLLMAINFGCMQRAFDHMRHLVNCPILNYREVRRAGALLDANHASSYLHVDDVGIFATSAALASASAIPSLMR